MRPTLPNERFPALGSTAVVVCQSPEGLAAAVEAVGQVLDDISVSCSRFRSDSEISRVNGARGAWTQVSHLFIEALTAALEAAGETDGLVDPTVGEALMRIGYDRDFASVPPIGPSVSSVPAPGWGSVELDVDRQRVRLQPGVRIDLGATAKAFAADRAAESATRHAGYGVLVALGGDIATAGASPPGGWTVGVADDHAAEAGTETISIQGGGLATSSTTVRRWSRGDRAMHHIVDPRTGMPAAEVWRTVSVAAATCLGANTASTASMILGASAVPWLERRHLPARLVSIDGQISRIGGWPLERAA